jgi:hypothetical protein
MANGGLAGVLLWELADLVEALDPELPRTRLGLRYAPTSRLGRLADINALPREKGGTR